MNHMFRALAVWLLLCSGAMAQGSSGGGQPFSLYQPSVTSTLTRPANTTAYAGSSGTPQLIASSTTAGSVVVPSFTIGATGGVFPKLLISTNVTTGWGSVVIVVTLWTAAPTYSNGDGGTYAVATGYASKRTSFSCTLTQYVTGAQGTCTPTDNVPEGFLGSTVYWDMQIQSAATPISGQTFTVTPEVWN